MVNVCWLCICRYNTQCKNTLKKTFIHKQMWPSPKVCPQSDSLLVPPVSFFVYRHLCQCVHTLPEDKVYHMTKVTSRDIRDITGFCHVSSLTCNQKLSDMQPPFVWHVTAWGILPLSNKNINEHKSAWCDRLCNLQRFLQFGSYYRNHLWSMDDQESASLS